MKAFILRILSLVPIFIVFFPILLHIGIIDENLFRNLLSSKQIDQPKIASETGGFDHLYSPPVNEKGEIIVPVDTQLATEKNVKITINGDNTTIIKNLTEFHLIITLKQETQFKHNGAVIPAGITTISLLSPESTALAKGHVTLAIVNHPIVIGN